MGRPELADDPRFSSSDARKRNERHVDSRNLILVGPLKTTASNLAPLIRVIDEVRREAHRRKEKTFKENPRGVRAYPDLGRKEDTLEVPTSGHRHGKKRITAGHPQHDLSDFDIGELSMGGGE